MVAVTVPTVQPPSRLILQPFCCSHSASLNVSHTFTDGAPDGDRVGARVGPRVGEAVGEVDG